MRDRWCLGSVLFALLALASVPPAHGEDVLVFLSRRAGVSSISRINPDGTGLVNLTPDVSVGGIDVAASPDGQWLAFVTAGRQLYRMRLDGSERVLVTSPAEILGIGWSADGSQIYFTRPGTCAEDLYAVGTDGSGPRLLVDAGVDFPHQVAYKVSQSVDEELAVVGVYCWPDSALYLMNPDRTNVREVLHHSNAARWSPDGLKLVVQRYNGNMGPNPVYGAPNHNAIWTMNRDGSGLTQLTTGEPCTDGNPAWSPDGSKITFERYDWSTGVSRIMVMDADGSNVRQVSNESGTSDSAPIWVRMNLESGNHLPSANAGGDRAVEADSAAGATVLLDGSGSSDPDGDALTYYWSGDFGVAEGMQPTIELPLGTHTITLTVDDGKGGISSDAVIVTARDTTPPMLEYPSAITEETAGPSGAVVSFVVSALDTVSGNLPVTCSAASGSLFAPGATTVTCEAHDASGNSAAASFVVTVIPLPSVSISDIVVHEGDSGTTPATFHVNLSRASNRAVTVDYSTEDGTAVSGGDYQVTSGALTFPPGLITQTVTVPVVGDRSVESDEMFTVELAHASGATIATGDAPVETAWSQSHPVGALSPPRGVVGRGSTYDEANDRLILFGGHQPSVNGTYNDVWVLANATDGSSAAWIRLEPTGGSPSPRFHVGAAYDATENVLIVHGGCAGGRGCAKNDTWLLTNANGLGGVPTWVQLPWASVARNDPAVSYDPGSNRLIVFGGMDQADALRNDVWVLTNANGSGGASEWFQLIPEGIAPSARQAAQVAYDQGSNRLVVHGGGDNTGALADLWILTNANGLGGTPMWIRQSPASGPSGRGHAGFAYDPLTKRAAVFGGSTASGQASDFWILLNADGTTGQPRWVSRSLSGTSPQRRAAFAYGYSGANARMVIAAGVDGSMSYGDVWVLDNAMGVSLDGQGQGTILNDDANHVPVASAGSDQIIEATSADGARVSLDGSASTDPDGDALTYRWGGDFGVAEGAQATVQLGLGSHTITLTVDDGNGGAATVDVLITVTDRTAPTLDLPAGMTVEATGPSGASASYVVSATDAVSGTLPVTCAPASGETFELAATAVNCEAEDAAGNRAASSFIVTVRDTTPPDLVGVPASILVEATGAEGATATWIAPRASDLVDLALPVSCVPAAGSVFPLGMSTVSCTASDSHANRRSADFSVMVRDSLPPVLDVPAGLTIEATSAAGAHVTYTVSAVDTVSGSVVATCSPASGSVFTLGTTTVACTAIDAAGNKAMSQFAVNVRDTTPPVIAAVIPSQGTLWPPNHQMVPVSVAVSASDFVDASAHCSILEVASNEPVNGLGDGDTAPDWLVTGDLMVQLRAERAGGGAGRVYSISVTCRDAAGNSSPPGVAAVLVPRSQARR